MDSTVLQYTQLDRIQPMKYYSHMYAKSGKEPDLYELSSLTDILIKEVDLFICHSLREYCVTTPNTVVTYIKFKAELRFQVEKVFVQQPASDSYTAFSKSDCRHSWNKRLATAEKYNYCLFGAWNFILFIALKIWVAYVLPTNISMSSLSKRNTAFSLKLTLQTRTQAISAFFVEPDAELSNPFARGVQKPSVYSPIMFETTTTIRRSHLRLISAFVVIGASF